MNRIRHATRTTEDTPLRSSFDVEVNPLDEERRETVCALFGPQHYEPKYAYPLIVWIHGPDDDERQLKRIMPAISLRNYAAVAPRGFLPVGRDCRGEGFGWPQTASHIEEAECRVLESVEAARRRFHVAPSRVFLAGFDAGGTMVFRVAMNHPRRFAGVLSICGAFPIGHTPFRCLSEARHLPVFLALGRDSKDYPPVRACENLRLFHTAGIPVTMRQYPCGQQLTHQMLRDVDRWIIEQITHPADLPHEV
ncbi:MAG: alpha/beta hydrolase [Planctomycetota bacterium]|jgi:phospholipase/carboxylesterase